MARTATKKPASHRRNPEPKRRVVVNTKRPVVANGEGGSTADGIYRQLMSAFNRSPQSPSAFFERSRFVNSNLDPTGRDVDKECGYITTPSIDEYREIYNRWGIAARAVNIWPDECWAAYPELYESDRPRNTRFEQAWAELASRTLPWHYLHRADRLSGIGRFGTLLMGIADGRKLDSPALGLDPISGEPNGQQKETKLQYLRAFDESYITILNSEPNTNSPRYGQPTYYQMEVSDPANPKLSSKVNVHWTRVLHLADNRESSEIEGVPRLQHVLNYVYDIRKVAGSSAEMFWKGGFPGYAFETWPDLAGQATVDRDAVKEEVRAYTEGLQRFLTAVGGSWKPLMPQVADPTNHITQLLLLLCATIGVPLRIFVGSEAGHLASTQDAGTWKDRLRGRQTRYLEPLVVMPFVNRLVYLGCLPAPRQPLKLSWRDLQTLSDKDQADVALKRIQALMQYVTGGVESVMPVKMMLTLFMGLTESQSDAVVAELEVMKKKLTYTNKVVMAGTQGTAAGKKGFPAKGRSGAPAGKSPSAN